jgi:hypothetical protein
VILYQFGYSLAQYGELCRNLVVQDHNLPPR